MRASHNPATPFDDYLFESVSFEAIYRLLSPYKDPIGLAMYFEPTLGDDAKELEWEVILQKNWFKDRLVWALNLNYELEFEKADNGYERDGVFEWFTGISYSFDATVHEHSAYFVGPTIHYGGERWWVTLGFLHQLPIGEAFSNDNQEFAAHDGYILGDEHEKYYVRLRVGLDF